MGLQKGATFYVAPLIVYPTLAVAGLGPCHFGHGRPERVNVKCGKAVADQRARTVPALLPHR